MHLEPFVIDDIYSALTEREEVQFLLNELGYGPRTTRDFKIDGLTDSEIKKLILESKKVTIQQIRELLEKAKISLDQCVKCGRYVSKKKGINLWPYGEHETVIKKGKIYCRRCWNRDHPPSHCFIATAAYGTPMAKEIEILRDFRDKKLESTQLGRQMVLLYYRTSPPIAEIISHSERMRAAVRYTLNPIIDALKRKNSRNLPFQDASNNVRRKKSRGFKTHWMNVYYQIRQESEKNKRV